MDWMHKDPLAAKKVSILVEELSRVMNNYMPEGHTFVLIVHSATEKRLSCTSNAPRNHVIDYLRTTMLHLRKLTNPSKRKMN